MSWMTWTSLLLLAGSLCYLIYSLVAGIRSAGERGASVWKQFGLSLTLLVLFANAWVSQGLAEWQEFVSEQLALGEGYDLAGFLPRFLTSTMSNHQSEFLQLFAFVTLSARHIHKGSAESRDSDEAMQASLEELHRKVDENRGRVDVMLSHLGL